MKINSLFLVLILGLTLGCTFQTDNYNGDTMAPPISGWAQSGEILPGDSQSKVTMQTQFPISGNYTCQFNLANDNSGFADLGTGGFIRARAEITWSVAGNSVRRVIDCNTGVTITGVAEAVAVTIYDDSVLGVGAAPRPYVVSVQCGRGSRPSVSKPPTYSLDRIELAAPSGTSALIEIPQDIGAISLFSGIYSFGGGTDPLPPNSIRLNQLSPAAILSIVEPRQAEWIPLFPGTTAITYQTTADALGDVEISPYIGIDG